MIVEPMTDADRARLERLIHGFNPQQFALTAGEAQGLFARVSALKAENARLRDNFRQLWNIAYALHDHHDEGEARVRAKAEIERLGGLVLGGPDA